MARREMEEHGRRENVWCVMDFWDRGARGEGGAGVEVNRH